MNNMLLHMHSGLRWVVLATLLFALVRSYSGWLGKRTWSKTDNLARMVAVLSAHLQLIVGIVLFMVSPLITVFLSDFGGNMKDPVLRFFGMEHSLMMFVAVIAMTVFSAIAKRKKEDVKKFRTLAIGFTLVLLLIFAMIPWPWSGDTARGWF